jgi:hypothetical protein
MGADERGARPPFPRYAEPRRRARQHEPIDAIALLRRDPHPDHRTEREPAERDSAHADACERVEDRVGEFAHRPSRWVLIADHLEPLAELPHLRVPQGHRRSQRVEEDQRASAFWAGDGEVHPRADAARAA